MSKQLPLDAETMQVRLKSLDRLLDLAGEVIIVSSNLNALTRTLHPGETVSSNLTEGVKDLAITSSRISSDLHNLVVDVRTVTMSDLFTRFRRLVRDISRRLGKPVHLTLQGEEICIDKTVSEKIYDPIAHQIRNAITHGIEDPEVRKAQKKDPVGQIRVAARHLVNSTVIEVSDDGQGIDLERVRARAIEQGLVSAEDAAHLRTDQIYEFLYQAGFSTAAAASTDSGRGVGMDVIRSAMEEIGGETHIESVRKQGTTFSFIIPLVSAVNITDALVVEAGEIGFAFPISAVVATQAIQRKDITTTTGKGRSIVFLGKILPLFDLMTVFGEPPAKVEGDTYPVIIIEHKKTQLAYIVSAFQNPQKLVITEFDESMRVPGLSGTAVLSGRQLGMIIDVPQLFTQTLGKSREVDKPAGRNASIADAVASIPQADSVRTAANGAANQTLETAIEMPGADFLSEVESMLARLNRELLVLDEKRDKETMDAVFRLAHSIKGNLTMYGIDEPSAVTHYLESLLDKGRRGVLELTDEIFDVLFDGASYLERAIAALLRNTPAESPSDKLVAALDELTKEKGEAGIPVDVDTTQVTLDSTGEFYLSSRRRAGVPLYQARIEFESGDQPRFLIAYMILCRIQRVADVIGSAPPLTDIEKGFCEDSLVVLFAERDPTPGLIDKLGDNLKTYYGITRFDATAYA